MPLNYNENDEFFINNSIFKRVLLIPYNDLFSSVLMVPEPYAKHVDIYILEVPMTTMLDETGKEVHDPTQPIPVFVSDPFSQRNTTLFFDEPKF